jgi:hypothetical protein
MRDNADAELPSAPEPLQPELIAATFTAWRRVMRCSLVMVDPFGQTA